MTLYKITETEHVIFDSQYDYLLPAFDQATAILTDELEYEELRPSAETIFKAICFILDIVYREQEKYSKMLQLKNEDVKIMIPKVFPGARRGIDILFDDDKDRGYVLLFRINAEFDHISWYWRYGKIDGFGEHKGDLTNGSVDALPSLFQVLTIKQ